MALGDAALSLVQECHCHHPFVLKSHTTIPYSTIFTIRTVVIQQILHFQPHYIKGFLLYYLESWKWKICFVWRLGAASGYHAPRLLWASTSAMNCYRSPKNYYLLLILVTAVSILIYSYYLWIYRLEVKKRNDIGAFSVSDGCAMSLSI